MQLRLKASVEDQRIAHMAAIAIGIHVLESLLPSPLPGIKPGLANIITLVVFVMYGLSFAAWVSLLRVLVGSLIIGTFLSPTFMLSVSGAIASLIMLYVVTRFIKLDISVFGIAILMAIAHMTAQFLTVYVFFIPHLALFDAYPIMMTIAVCFGAFNGYFALRVIDKLKGNNASPTSHTKPTT